MQTIILAAGLGTRLEPLTNISKISKVMTSIVNKPFIEWVLDSCKNPVVVVRKNQHDLINFLKNKNIELIYQKKPLGTGDALLSCKNFVDEKFLVINGDCLYDKKDIKKFSGYAIGGFFTYTKNFGKIISENNIIKNIKEKTEKGKGIVNTGLYSLDSEIFSYLEKTKKSPRSEIELTDALKNLMKEHVVKLIKLNSWKTITYPWDILDINKFILKKNGSQISENAQIKNGAYIEEPVAIGNSIIGPNCYIRENSSIGNNCKIGNAVEIKNSIIMNNSFVSHLSYVGDSIVGKNCNIGAGTIFANLRLDGKSIKTNIKKEIIETNKKKLGSFLADNVKLGVNVTIMPGKKIWHDIMIPSNSIIVNDVKKQPDLKKNLGKVI